MKPAYLPLYVRDWRSDPKVALLSWEERMLYLDMLMLSWEHGPLPDDPARILRALGAPHPPELVLALFGSLWSRVDAGWVSPRLERERARTEAAISSNAKRTEAASRARWIRDGQRDGQRDVHPHGYRNDHPRAPEPEPVPSDSVSPVADSSSSRSSSEESGTPSAPACLPGMAPPKKTRSKRTEAPEWSGEVPKALRRESFLSAWGRWLTYRRVEHRARVKVTQTAGDAQLAEFVGWGVDRSCRAIAFTMKNQWQGIREPEEPRNGRRVLDEDDTEAMLKKAGLR